MAEITVNLTENDVHAACREWAVTRILNGGAATDSTISVTACNGKPNGALTRVTVTVETERMTEGLPMRISKGLRPPKKTNE